MKKLINMVIIGSAVLLISLGAIYAYLQHQKDSQKKTYGAYGFYSGTFEIEEFAYVADKQGVVAHWKDQDPDETKIFKQYEKEIDTYTLSSSDAQVEFGGRYITRMNAKLKNEDFKADKGEYWNIDVYDTQANMKKHTLNLYKVFHAYANGWMPSSLAYEVDIIKGEEVIIFNLSRYSEKKMFMFG